MTNVYTNTCSDLIINLAQSVDKINNELIDHMTNQRMKYELACIKPDVTYGYFFERLKKEWETPINEFINRPEKCVSIISNIPYIYELMRSMNGSENPVELFNQKNIQNTRSLINSISKNNPEELREKITRKLKNISEDNIYDLVATALMKPPKSVGFELKENMIDSLGGLAKILYEYCSCQTAEIFKMIIEKYSTKYRMKFQEKTKSEIIEILKQDYEYFKSLLSAPDLQNYNKNIINDIATKLTGIYGFSIENELNKLIPDELGSLKVFFVIVISKYYNNLHPIIWAQIFKQMAENIFIELPFTPDDIFRFVSKYLLLNSGPFILKILQMIRPVLSPELAIKYNLTKLEYPKLKQTQVDLILGKVVNEWDMYTVLKHFSASVGHVCKVCRADKPNDIIMIKIIKPLAIAQSCWEYKTLYNVFKKGSCEQKFIKNILESNGRELNIENEKNNIKKGYEYYAATYKEIYGVDIDANLSAIDVVPNVIVDKTWFAVAMTLAPGIPLNALVEGDLLKSDTKYRAKLHRCLDLLVNKFFFNIIKHKYYHGDPHAGNIFFSFEKSMITLIDFGAVGELDLYENDETIHALLDIIIMSVFYNYEDIFDTMTKLLNSKCTETQIDTNSAEYQKLKAELKGYHLENVKNSKIEEKNEEKYEEDIFGNKRISQENAMNETSHTSGLPANMHQEFAQIESIYSYLEIEPKKDEAVIMNEQRDVLPPFTEILGDSESKTLPQILEIIIKFYALEGVNIAIKFNELYEFQKAYALLLGVLHKTGYNSYRSGIAIKKAIFNWSNIPALIELKTMKHVISSYWSEKNKYNELNKQNGVFNEQSNQHNHYKFVQAGGDKYYFNKYLKYKNKCMNLFNHKNI
jgi:hypothetical protein